MFCVLHYVTVFGYPEDSQPDQVPAGVAQVAAVPISITCSVCYIMSQFLDAQKIHNLTKYLQALHKSQLATEEHTTLLLNCYTKLKDVSKLDEFIMVTLAYIDCCECLTIASIVEGELGQCVGRGPGL